MFRARVIGEDAQLAVYMVLLQARRGPYPFVRFENLRDSLNLPNGDLEEALLLLEDRGRIERAEPSKGEVYYYAVW
jgi:hypothetical protein